MSKYGITLTVLATQLAEAAKKDENSTQEGLVISNGEFGMHVSAWLKKVAETVSGEKRPRKAV